MHGAVWRMTAWHITHCLVTFELQNDEHKVWLMTQVVHNVPVLQDDVIIIRYQSQLSRNHVFSLSLVDWDESK